MSLEMRRLIADQQKKIEALRAEVERLELQLADWRKYAPAI